MAITDTEALTRTIEHREIFHDEMVDLFRQIMRGEARREQQEDRERFHSTAY